MSLLMRHMLPISRSELREWRVSAIRMQAGVLSGITYPDPATMIRMCEILEDLLVKVDPNVPSVSQGDDIGEILDWIEGLEHERDDAVTELADDRETLGQENEDLKERLRNVDAAIRGSEALLCSRIGCFNPSTNPVCHACTEKDEELAPLKKGRRP